MPLMVLNNTVKKMQVLLGGAVSANECPITVSYNEIDKDGIGSGERSMVPQSADSITTSGTAVDVLGAAPTGKRREVVGFSLFNADSATVAVTIRQYVDASTTRIITTVSLLTGQTLFYSEARGFYALNTNAEQKTTASSEASTALSTATAVSSLQSLASVQSFTATNFSTISSGVSLDRVVSSIQSVLSTASLTNTTWSTVSSQVSLGANVSSLQSLASVQSFTATTFSTISSGVSLDRVVSSLQSLASVQSFTATSFSTVSSAVSRVKSSFTW